VIEDVNSSDKGMERIEGGNNGEL